MELQTTRPLQNGQQLPCALKVDVQKEEIPCRWTPQYRPTQTYVMVYVVTIGVIWVPGTSVRLEDDFTPEERQSLMTAGVARYLHDKKDLKRRPWVPR